MRFSVRPQLPRALSLLLSLYSLIHSFPPLFLSETFSPAPLHPSLSQGTVPWSAQSSQRLLLSLSLARCGAALITAFAVALPSSLPSIYHFRVSHPFPFIALSLQGLAWPSPPRAEAAAQLGSAQALRPSDSPQRRPAAADYKIRMAIGFRSESRHQPLRHDLRRSEPRSGHACVTHTH